MTKELFKQTTFQIFQLHQSERNYQFPYNGVHSLVLYPLQKGLILA